MKNKQKLMLEKVKSDLILELLIHEEEKELIYKAFDLTYDDLFEYIMHSSKSKVSVYTLFKDGIPMPF